MDYSSYQNSSINFNNNKNTFNNSELIIKKNTDVNPNYESITKVKIKNDKFRNIILIVGQDRF